MRNSLGCLPGACLPPYPPFSLRPPRFSSVLFFTGSGALDPESLQIWVVKVVTPLVGLFTWENGGLYQEIGLPELTAYTKVGVGH